MCCRVFVFVSALGVLPIAPLAGQTQRPAAKGKTWTMPHAADGHPDLQGIWTNATITPLERPAAFAEKPTLTDAEATAFEKYAANELNKLDGASEGPLLAVTGSSGTGGYNVLFLDRGSELARVGGVKRTSLVVAPPDGKVPPITPETRDKFARMLGRSRSDSVQERPLS